MPEWGMIWRVLYLENIRTKRKTEGRKTKLQWIEAQNEAKNKDNLDIFTLT